MVPPYAIVALPPFTRNEVPLAPLNAPPDIVRVPTVLVSETLLTPEDDVTLENVAARVPPLKLSAWPVPLTAQSLTVRVPKFEPDMPVPVLFPTVSPSMVFDVPRMIASVAATVVVSVGAAPPVVGSGTLYGCGVRPVMLARLAVAP